MTARKVGFAPAGNFFLAGNFRGLQRIDHFARDFVNAIVENELRLLLVGNFQRTLTIASARELSFFCASFAIGSWIVYPPSTPAPR